MSMISPVQSDWPWRQSGPACSREWLLCVCVSAMNRSWRIHEVRVSAVRRALTTWHSSAAVAMTTTSGRSLVAVGGATVTCCRTWWSVKITPTRSMSTTVTDDLCTMKFHHLLCDTLWNLTFTCEVYTEQIDWFHFKILFDLIVLTYWSIRGSSPGTYVAVHLVPTVFYDVIHCEMWCLCAKCMLKTDRFDFKIFIWFNWSRNDHCSLV